MHLTWYEEAHDGENRKLAYIDFSDIEAYIQQNELNANETLALSNPTSPEEAKQALLNGKEIYFNINENIASLSLPEPWKTQGQW